eukprot:4857100-Amphidinium_carterae.1
MVTAIIARIPTSGSAPVKLLWEIENKVKDSNVWMPSSGSLPSKRLPSILKLLKASIWESEALVLSWSLRSLDAVGIPVCSQNPTSNVQFPSCNSKPESSS